MLRQAVRELVALGPLPSEDAAEEEQLQRYEQLLHSITRPVTDEEAIALVGLFGPDDCYELAWTMLHLIETAPGWPIEARLQDTSNEWIVRLRRRAANARRLSEA